MATGAAFTAFINFSFTFALELPQNTDSSLALFWTDFCCEESIDQRVWSMEVPDAIYDSRLKIGDVEKSVVNV